MRVLFCGYSRVGRKDMEFLHGGLEDVECPSGKCEDRRLHHTLDMVEEGDMDGGGERAGN